MKTTEQLWGDTRYAIRLCSRTARLYRRIQTAGTFLAIVGGSATIVSALGTLPHWLAASGSSLLAIAGAALIAIRPADKAAQNEADVRRYQAVLENSIGASVEAFAAALEQAHQGDAPEVDALRNVAYNDMVKELGMPEHQIPLSATERVLRAIA